MILRASELLDPAGEASIRGGALWIRDGRIHRVLRTARAIGRAESASGRRSHDLGDGLLAPGFVDAHAHLELGALRGALSHDRGFVTWIGEVLASRRELDAAAYETGLREGEARLLETGTTTVGDIASTPEAASASRTRLRSIVYREVLDAWNPERTDPALAVVSRALEPRALRREGISPHAPYTTSPALLGRVAALRKRRRLPVSIHWAETEDEVRWLRDGGGAFARVLDARPSTTGLAMIERAGLLDASTSLVHGNHPGRGDLARLAARQVVVVHCPGTHAFFGRAPFPWQRYRRAGVRVALGTDSLASNADLDMRREMALVRRAQPGVAPAEVLRMATVHAAHAVGLGGRVGELRPGTEADLAFHRFSHASGVDPLEALTSAETDGALVWVRGRRAAGRAS